MLAPLTPKTTAANPVSITRLCDPHFETTLCRREKVVECHATVRLVPNDTPGAMERLARFLGEHQMEIVRVEAFGSVAACPATTAHLRRLFPEFPGPVVWLEGKAPGNCLAGLHLFAVAGAEVATVWDDNSAVGAVFTDGFARHLVLNNVTPRDLSAPAPEQARQMFERLENILEQFKLDFHHVARTWLYLDRILEWYGPFNCVRTDLFTKWKVFDGIVPASTGIGLQNAAAAAVVSGLWAVQPLSPSSRVREILSPLQCPAPSYGSSFSRAVEISAPDCRRVLVSGTASIHPDGTTARLGDVAGQIELTMDVIEAILRGNDLDFSDATRVTAYFPDIRNAPLLALWCKERKLRLPLLMAQGDVCREDLLFELELDAVTCGKDSPPSSY